MKVVYSMDHRIESNSSPGIPAVNHAQAETFDHLNDVMFQTSE